MRLARFGGIGPGRTATEPDSITSAVSALRSAMVFGMFPLPPAWMKNPRLNCVTRMLATVMPRHELSARPVSQLFTTVLLPLMMSLAASRVSQSSTSAPEVTPLPPTAVVPEQTSSSLLVAVWVTTVSP